jgi:hypothetical protein
MTLDSTVVIALTSPPFASDVENFHFHVTNVAITAKLTALHATREAWYTTTKSSTMAGLGCSGFFDL